MAMKANSRGPVLRQPTVTNRLGIAKSTLYSLLNPKSKYYDPTFPTPIRLTHSTVGWLESEIDAWLQSRIEASRNGMS